ncbi:MAG: TolC family protein [Gammaproteobacteria bacterium]|uniref:TolC family protein n=1 Tax=Limnobacter sp. TaxID=2003368 RepID=UPI001D776F32|nr:TolC family protein [Limnobacter sp.]MBU0783144.1 TolC family protein [Gammaproteobacteria bacterium]MBU0849731.1 TolC family protein [Gammaproteobacteria bacterium]MBU1266182.1 TolC family protein [Gammaproteobacteria bacterium]MBU1529373.1 TolC family protein [Gammaproteobacteria bacterium]MBU1779248.1 TolC family protein [Gammaproteobacteria bacterium]
MNTRHIPNTRLKTLPASIVLVLCALSAPGSWAQQSQEIPEVQSQAPAENVPPAEKQAPNPLQQSVIKGLQNSPTLNADIHALEAQMEESNVVFGTMLPTVDARGSTGRERTRIEDADTRTYNANSYGIEARQNLYNGFASHARYFASYSGAMQSYYRYLNKANQVAFDASSSHVDVSRFQALTQLSEDNLKYHQDLMNRIEEKVKSGVTRQSDLEQARSRYTLALGNLATEKANTFSAMANYQRITDTVWPVNQAGEYVVNANFEVENRERLVFALNNHPLLKAANAQISGAKQEVTAASEGFHPRIDLRAKTDVYSNYLSTFNERQISSVDVLATINLYRGGSDNASRNAAIKRRLRSMDDKLTICRAIRQSTQTSLFDVVSSQKKLNYFREQAAAITKARAAYEQQFAVGRRSLLDLLSAENEYYQAQRALINIEADLSISKLKLLAATGQLITLFSVDELVKADEPTRREVILYKEQSQKGAEAEGCPASLINLEDFELPNIGFDEALKSVDATPSLAPIELAQLGNGVVGQQVAAFGDPAEVSKSLIDKTKSWAKAWENKDVNSYIAFYAPNFKPEEGSYEAWETNRRERISKAQQIDIEISEMQVVPSFDKPDEYEISFVQDYRAKFYQERSRKVLTWRENKGVWQIIREQNLPMNTVNAPNKKNLNLAEAPSAL